MVEALIASAVAAQMAITDRTPFSIDVLTYLWVVVVASAGGIVSFLRKIRTGQSRAFNLVELVGEIVTSAFTGLITFWLCEWAQINPMLSAVFIAVTGHMGSRALFYFERVIEKWMNTKTGVIITPDQENKP